MQTYQTHIFAPPVTGAPVKKSKLSGAASSGNLGPNGSVLTLGKSSLPAGTQTCKPITGYTLSSAPHESSGATFQHQARVSSYTMMSVIEIRHRS